MSTSVTDKAKEVTKKAVDAVKGNKEKPITNDSLDSTPPGSASINERGVPSRSFNESKGVSTPRAGSKVSDSVSEPEDVQIVQTMPYQAPNPLAEARKEARAKRSFASDDEDKKPRSTGEKDKLSVRAIAALVRTASFSDMTTAKEIQALIGDVHPDTKREVEQMLKNPQLFAGDQRPANLQSLGSLPGAQKPIEFDAAPGTTAIPDNRYYPTRYAIMPDEEQFEDGDLIYSVHEDGSYTVLSVYQQSRDWQTANHLPMMNLISRVGGEVSDMPKALKQDGFIDRNEDIAEDYDAKTAEAK